VEKLSINNPEPKIFLDERRAFIDSQADGAPKVHQALASEASLGEGFFFHLRTPEPCLQKSTSVLAASVTFFASVLASAPAVSVEIPFFYPSISLRLAQTGCFETAKAAPSTNEL
jgi:hypothetical protein